MSSHAPQIDINGLTVVYRFLALLIKWWCSGGIRTRTLQITGRRLSTHGHPSGPILINYMSTDENIFLNEFKNFSAMWTALAWNDAEMSKQVRHYHHLHQLQRTWHLLKPLSLVSRLAFATATLSWFARSPVRTTVSNIIAKLAGCWITTNLVNAWWVNAKSYNLTRYSFSIPLLLS